MKTRKEVLEHLAKVGYTVKAMNRIAGFLVGTGIATKDEDLDMVHGTHKWEEFMTWWEKEDTLSDLFEYLAERFYDASDDERVRIASFIEFLTEEFCEEEVFDDVD